jgi:hypothetical protein
MTGLAPFAEYGQAQGMKAGTAAEGNADRGPLTPS